MGVLGVGLGSGVGAGAGVGVGVGGEVEVGVEVGVGVGAGAGAGVDAAVGARVGPGVNDDLGTLEPHADKNTATARTASGAKNFVKRRFEPKRADWKEIRDPGRNIDPFFPPGKLRPRTSAAT